MDILTATQIGAAAEFQSRVRFALIKSAVSKLSGTPSGAETLLGQRILDEREPVGPWITATLANADILAGAHTLPGNSITDGQIDTAIAALWPVFVI